MTYKQITRLCVIADALFLIGLPIIFLLESNELLPSGIELPLCIVIAALFIIVGLYCDYGKHKQWRNLWEQPMWQNVAYWGMIIAVLLYGLFSNDDGKDSIFMPIMAIIFINYFINDIRKYINARKYDMDNIEDVNELIRRYPELETRINREIKKRGETKHEETNEKTY